MHEDELFCRYENGLKLVIEDRLSPEDIAMVQALYSRSTNTCETHIKKALVSGSSKFCSNYVVGYNHKSIADCGTTTIFFEGLSILADKVVQDWPLYSGQETSTRYIDFSTTKEIDPQISMLGGFVDPVGTKESASLLQSWMDFYTESMPRVIDKLARIRPSASTENEKAYEGMIKARAFDILRGFIPAGARTQCSWHTNLRQAGDHLTEMTYHPLEEVRLLATFAKRSLHEKYDASGFDTELSSLSGVRSEGLMARQEWMQRTLAQVKYDQSGIRFENFKGPVDIIPNFTLQRLREIQQWERRILDRPRGCIIPHEMAALGSLTFRFLLDYGSFRDIQRHRNGVCPIPLLTTEYGMHPWYLNQLDQESWTAADRLIKANITTGKRVANVSGSPKIQQYYIPIGYQVPVTPTYAIPGAVYTMELRSGKTIHPTLRQRIHQMVDVFAHLPFKIPMHIDNDSSDWDIRRGTQTITEK